MPDSEAISTLRELHTLLSTGTRYKQNTIKKLSTAVEGFLTDCFWCDINRIDVAKIVFTITDRKRFMAELKSKIAEDKLTFSR